MFNVVVDGIYILGLRVVNGFIIPPASKNQTTGKYYPITYFCKEVAEKIYDGILEKGIKLKDKEEALHDLLIDAGKIGAYYDV